MLRQKLPQILVLKLKLEPMLNSVDIEAMAVADHFTDVEDTADVVLEVVEVVDAGATTEVSGGDNSCKFCL